MARRPIVVRWTPEEIEKLKALVAQGASAARAAAATKRKIMAVQVKARELGTPFSPIRTERKKRQEPLAKNELRPWRSF
ncbi:MAG: hypothetical protein JWR89_5156 [Tardiphaga sp.]|nr:hypothetical protein [Tardiphaga sp.]